MSTLQLDKLRLIAQKRLKENLVNIGGWGK